MFDDIPDGPLEQARMLENILLAACSHGATLNLWAAIALDRADDVRTMIIRQPSLLESRMSRNQHRRTPLHHAAAKDRPRIVRLLLKLGADPEATDATGATPITTVSQEGAGTEVIDALLAAGAPLDFLTAVNLERYNEAGTMLREDPVPERLADDGLVLAMVCGPFVHRLPDVNAVVQKLVDVALVDQLALLAGEAFGTQCPHGAVAEPILTKRSKIIRTFFASASFTTSLRSLTS